MAQFPTGRALRQPRRGADPFLVLAAPVTLALPSRRHPRRAESYRVTRTPSTRLAAVSRATSRRRGREEPISASSRPGGVVLVRRRRFAPRCCGASAPSKSWRPVLLTRCPTVHVHSGGWSHRTGRRVDG